MALTVLKNDTVSLTVDSCGAEMISLKNAEGREYLWNGDPLYWKRHAPVLFPLVGSLKNKQYRIGEKTYPMGQHGFASDVEFALVSATDTECWFQLTESMASLTVYPYEFILEVGYRLGDGSVETIWKVNNPASRPLHFSLGGHPAFVCPRTPGERQSDYRLRFDAEGPLVSGVIGEGGLLSDAVKKIQLTEGTLPIDSHLFDDDALILEGGQAHKVSLVAPDGEDYVTVSFDAPLFGVWSCPGREAPFVCIEPWYGRCDAADFDGEWSERAWSNTLGPGETFEGGFTVEIK